MEVDDDEEHPEQSHDDEEGDSSMGESEPEEAMNMTWKELCGLKKTELLAVAEQLLDATAKETFDPAWTKTPMAAFLTEHKMPRAKCTTLVDGIRAADALAATKTPKAVAPKVVPTPRCIF
jgi:hypothetical protein